MRAFMIMAALLLMGCAALPLRTAAAAEDAALTARVNAFVNLKRTNSYIRPLISYAFTDHVTATLGAELYHGADDTFFGRVRRNQSAFAEVRYSF